MSLITYPLLLFTAICSSFHGFRLYPSPGVTCYGRPCIRFPCCLCSMTVLDTRPLLLYGERLFLLSASRTSYTVGTDTRLASALFFLTVSIVGNCNQMPLLTPLVSGRAVERDEKDRHGPRVRRNPYDFHGNACAPCKHPHGKRKSQGPYAIGSISIIAHVNVFLCVVFSTNDNIAVPSYRYG